MSCLGFILCIVLGYVITCVEILKGLLVLHDVQDYFQLLIVASHNPRNDS